MERFVIRIQEKDIVKVRSITAETALQFEPPFFNRLQCKLKEYFDEKGEKYVVHIDKSRNVNVIASVKLQPIGFYASVATVESFQNHKLRIF
jgi:hypothetical protein